MSVVMKQMVAPIYVKTLMEASLNCGCISGYNTGC